MPDERADDQRAPRPGEAEAPDGDRPGPGPLRLRAGAATDRGRVRNTNEDAYVLQAPMFAVADGMGGENAGEVAAGLAIDTLRGKGGQPMRGSSLSDRVQSANRAVFERSQNEAAVAGMGTTLTAVMADGDRLWLAHAGDSRAYLLRGGALTRLTTDHTKVQELVDLGVITPDEAQVHPQRNVITRALGLGSELQVDEAVIPFEPGDRVLLCSDGLTGMIDDATILSLLREAGSPQEAAERLVAAANEAGGADNVTAVVVDAEAAAATGFVARRTRHVWVVVGILVLLAVGLASLVAADLGPFGEDASSPSPPPAATPPPGSPPQSAADLDVYLDYVRGVLPAGADTERPFPGLVVEDLEGLVTCDELRSSSEATALALGSIPPPDGVEATLAVTVTRAVGELEAVFARSMPALADQIELASRASADRRGELLEEAANALEAIDRRYAAAYDKLIRAIGSVDPARITPTDAVARPVCEAST